MKNTNKNNREGITGNQILQEFELGLPKIGEKSVPNTEEIKEKKPVENAKIVSQKRTRRKDIDPEIQFGFLYENVKDKANNAIYLSDDAHKQLRKLAFAINLDMRKIGTNIINKFFEDNEEDLKILYKKLL